MPESTAGEDVIRKGGNYFSYYYEWKKMHGDQCYKTVKERQDLGEETSVWAQPWVPDT